MADEGREDRGRRPFEDDRRNRYEGDDRRMRSGGGGYGSGGGYGYGYGGREGGQSRDYREPQGFTGYEDRAGDGRGQRGGMRADEGPMSGNRFAEGSRADHGSGAREVGGRDRDEGGRRGTPGFPSYGESVGYMDRGFSPNQPEGGMPGYGGPSTGGYGGQGRGDYGSGGNVQGAGRFEGSQSGGSGYGGSGYGPMGGMTRGHNEPQGYDQNRPDHRGRGPKGWKRSDDRILEDVHERLADDPQVDASEIEVRVENGEVTLNGTVDSRQAKRRAEDCAESVSGVTHCQNNLRVAHGSSQAQAFTGGGQTASTDQSQRQPSPRTGLTAGGAYSGLEGSQGDPGQEGRMGQTNTSGEKTDLADRPRH